MTTEQILCMDCRKESNRAKLQKALHMIPQFKKEKGDVPISLFEKMMYVVTTKYAVTVQWISYILQEDQVYWSVSIRNDVDYSYMETITAVTIYELLAKVSIFLYAKVKNKELTTKEDLHIMKEKQRLKNED